MAKWEKRKVKIIKYKKYVVEHTCGHKQEYQAQKRITYRQAEKKIFFLSKFKCPKCNGYKQGVAL